MVIVLTGPAGSGKTTVGKALAARLGWVFVEGDRYHPYANIEKMARGVPLQDDDRWPWLAALRSVIREHLEREIPAVVACSALRARYRRALRDDGEDVVFVRLEVSPEELARRLAARTEHFAGANLLASQIEALEDGSELLLIDAHQPVDDIIDAIVAELPLESPGNR